MFEARFGILDEFTILEVYLFPSAIYHPYVSAGYHPIYMYVYGSGVVTSGHPGIPY